MNSSSTVWYFTDLPPSLVNEIEQTCNQWNQDVKPSSVLPGGETRIRNSENAWIPSSNWIAGYLWYYIQRANRENFLYDISHIDGETIQYTHYGPGQHYSWHVDGYITNQIKPEIVQSFTSNNAQDKVNLSGECSRKLSFVMQLSSPEDYSGGELQFLDGKKTFFAPKQRGAIIIFDGRLPHRVRKVKRGFRKSLVGWVVGPRWR